jgi:cytoskeletal protein RodZ
MALGPRTLLVQARASGRRGKLLLVLLPVFLVLVAIQAPRVLDAVGGTDATEQTATPESASTEPTATEPTATEPAPSGADAARPAAAVGQLPDTDPPAPAEIDKLASLDRFTAKDPFVQQVNAEAGAPAEETTPSDTQTDTTNESPPPSDEPAGDQPAAGEEGAAQVDVNGNVESVLTGRAFPSENPIFRLEAVTPTSVTITLVSGSFSAGREAVVLKIGQTATLVNDTNGRRYRIRFLSVG